MSELWWKKPMRVIQTNLQVKDTLLMNPAKIAGEIEEMAGNVLVINVGGIYAWYQSKVRYHHINEYLPKDFDLLASVIKECHNRSIRVIARFDFSKTDDAVFQVKPQWFVRDQDKKPRIYGKDRMGDWSLLLSTCINAGYRNEEVAIPVLFEVLDQYAIDGIFLNAPHYEPCHCETCKDKYSKTYGSQMPAHSSEFYENWPTKCVKDNIDKLYATIKKKNPEIPLILYYNLYRDNLDDRTATADLICTEAQDVLSRGYREIPQFWSPSLSMKMGNTPVNYPKPFGIIHSCPGMDWRHTGLPTAEYMFWMSQIPANNGHIWHSITGFNDTISDKRLLRSVSDINHMIQKTEDFMKNAQSDSQILLLWNGLKTSEGWAEGLVNNQFQFDIAESYQLTYEKLRKYQLVLLPENDHISEDSIMMLQRYVEDGGRLLVEGTDKKQLSPLFPLLGIQDSMTTSEYLAASYLKFEDGGFQLQKGLETTALIPHRGNVAYCQPNPDTNVLATLVPPFAPLDAVGAPPERASILTTQTDIPLATYHRFGKGYTLFLPFQLSTLINDYKLFEHYQFLRNSIDMLLNHKKKFCMEPVNGLQVMMYKSNRNILVHFVNGIGQRPLTCNIPFHDLTFSIQLDENTTVNKVYSCLSEESVIYEIKVGVLHCTLKKLLVWDMIVIETI